MKRQRVVTDWKDGAEPRVVYEDLGPSRARSKPSTQLDGRPAQGQYLVHRPGESGGRVKSGGSAQDGGRW